MMMMMMIRACLHHHHQILYGPISITIGVVLKLVLVEVLYSVSPHQTRSTSRQRSIVLVWDRCSTGVHGTHGGSDCVSSMHGSDSGEGR